MSYVGANAPIPFGDQGLKTDAPMTTLPPNAAIKANNISLTSSRLDKSLGSGKFNATALSAGVVGLIDWYPTATDQRLIALTRDGKIWRDTGNGTFGTTIALVSYEIQKVTYSAVPTSGQVVLNFAASTATVQYNYTAAQFQTAVRTLTGLSAAVVTGDNTVGYTITMLGTTGNQSPITFTGNTLSNGSAVTPTLTTLNQGKITIGTLDPNCLMISGGAESQGRNRKLFIYSNGASQIQVIDGDAVTYRDLQNPSADWNNGNYPTFGTIFMGYHIVTGCSSNPHAVYFSLLGDQETFNGSATTTPIFTIFPGEGNRIIAITVFKGRLFFLKEPYGVYYLETQNSPDPADWSPQRFSDAFGLASPHSFCQVLDDLVVGNNEGGLTSLKATQAFGDLKAGDVLTNLQVETYIRDQFNPAGIPYMQAIYYNEKKRAYFSGRSTANSNQNRMIVIDVARQTERVTIETKDQPSCLTLRKDSTGIRKPIYGAEDGHVYLMEQANYNVGGVAYLSEYQTPYIDFSYLDPSLASKNKIFDAIEVHFIATGNWNLYIDVFIDNRFSETVTLAQSGGAALDTFRLDLDLLATEYTQIRRPPLHGTGRIISFRFWNNQLNQYFKIEKVVVNFRLGGEQDKGISGVYRI